MFFFLSIVLSLLKGFYTTEQITKVLIWEEKTSIIIIVKFFLEGGVVSVQVHFFGWGGGLTNNNLICTSQSLFHPSSVLVLQLNGSMQYTHLLA